MERIGSLAFGPDSSGHYRGLGRPHPRGAGTFPRVFAEYVRNLKVLRLEEAVRRTTGLPAQIFDLPERGLIREGYWADLVLFDPARIRDWATMDDPWRPPEGIPYVVENGVLVVRNGKLTGALPGQPVRRRRSSSAAQACARKAARSASARSSAAWYKSPICRQGSGVIAPLTAQFAPWIWRRRA